MEMKIVQEDDTLSHVAMAGSFDSKGAADIEAEFFAHTAKRKLPLIVDLAGVDFMMSAGINLLTRCSTDLKSCGAKMVLLNPTALVAQAMRNVALQKLIPVMHDLDEAMQYIS